MSIQKITFKGVLSYLATKKSTVWNMVFQASQFDTLDFSSNVTYGHLTLNLGPNATRDMELFDDHVYFKIRKHGIVQEMSIPYTALMIIQDPDDAAESMPWPYFLDHGDELEPEPMTGEEYAIQRMAELGIKITPEQIRAHADEMHRSAPDMFDDQGRVNLFALSEKAQRHREANPTLEERMKKSNMTVIEGGKTKVIATLPWIDEVYRAKLAAREAKEIIAKNVDTQAESIRSDGSKGNSAFFPDLDVSKCQFPVKRTVRPDWLKVIEGGKNAGVPR